MVSTKSEYPANGRHLPDNERNPVRRSVSALVAGFRDDSKQPAIAPVQTAYKPSAVLHGSALPFEEMRS